MLGTFSLDSFLRPATLLGATSVKGGLSWRGRNTERASEPVSQARLKNIASKSRGHCRSPLSALQAGGVDDKIGQGDWQATDWNPYHDVGVDVTRRLLEMVGIRLLYSALPALVAKKAFRHQGSRLAAGGESGEWALLVAGELSLFPPSIPRSLPPLPRSSGLTKLQGAAPDWE